MFEFGMDIIRADFHLHTNRDKEFEYSGSEYINDYVDSLEKCEIKVGVITNHNKFDLDEYKELKRAAKKRNIFILPGVELSVKQGANAVHTLIVFNPDHWLGNGENHISKIIDAFFLGIDNAENENTTTNEDLMGCIQKLNSMGKDYFIIFAHVEQKGGFLEECKGGLISSLSQKKEFKERVLGFQKLRTRDLLKNAKEWMGYEIALVEGSDPKKIEEIGKGTKQTFIKIGEYTFDAVKYALKDYKSRIFEDKPQVGHGYIKSMKCLGGRLDGEELLISNSLNTLIGIRGSGKSSILEVMRYALNIDPATDEEYKKSLVKAVLGSGGQVILSVVDRHGKEYQIKRILNESVSILDESNDTLPISVDAVLNSPLYFGQKDLALTRAGYEMELLNKLVGMENDGDSGNVEKTVEELGGEIKKLLSVSDIPGRIAEINEKNAEIEHKLKIYKEKGIDAKLKKQTACNDDLAKLDLIYNNIQKMIFSLENAINKSEMETISLAGYQSQFNQDIFQEVITYTNEFTGYFNNIQDTISKLKISLEKLSAVKEKLYNRIESLKEEFAKIKREINDDTLDLDSYVTYKKMLTAMVTDGIWAKICEKIENNYLEYVKTSCPDLIKIMYHGKLLSRHSVGQRASALILFILTQQDSDVIIIDQPEDDLDNQVIYKELIQTIREKKKDMQFIFATHNANIPVLGDAEKIVTIMYDGDNEKIIMEQGSIDNKGTHKSIVDIMEGGEEAFKRRNEIYTLW